MQIDSPQQTAEQKAALMSTQGHLGISPAAAVVFSTQPCRDQKRDRHPRRKEPLAEKRGLGVLPWQEGQSALTGFGISHTHIRGETVCPLISSLCSSSASLLCFRDVFKGEK